VNTASNLPGIFGTLAPVLDHYGYLAVVGFIFLEDFGVPLPGETILIAAAVYAGAGDLNIALVALLAFVAAVAGDNVGYVIGTYGGRRVLERFGPYVRLTEERLNSAERWFADHGGKVIIIARFVEGLRQANGIIAGISDMRWLRFIGFNVIGAALWVALWVAVGALAGEHLDTVYPILRDALFGLVALAAVVVAMRWLRRRRTARRT
jgi:membrane protein DedA with SNARE-associated domain